MKNPPSFCVIKMEPDFWHTQKRCCFLKRQARKQKAKNALKIAVRKKVLIFANK